MSSKYRKDDIVYRDGDARIVVRDGVDLKSGQATTDIRVYDLKSSDGSHAHVVASQDTGAVVYERDA